MLTFKGVSTAQPTDSLIKVLTVLTLTEARPYTHILDIYSSYLR